MFHRKNPHSRTRENWGNFGDELSPLILQYLTGRPVHYSSPRHCDFIFIGSLLDKFTLYRASQLLQYHRWLPKPLHVFGTGVMLPTTKIRRGNLHLHAIRGPLSLERLPKQLQTNKIPYGDPGIFANELISPASKKTNFLGLIPHYIDRECPQIKNLLETIPNAKLINIMAHPHDVLKEISACEFILSSSLHGLIAADSLNVPNQWMKLSENVGGGDFKFRDYYLGLEKPLPKVFIPGKNTASRKSLEKLISLYQRGNIEHVKNQLRDALNVLLKEI